MTFGEKLASFFRSKNKKVYPNETQNGISCSNLTRSPSKPYNIGLFDNNQIINSTDELEKIDDFNKHVVIDLGSDSIRAGFSGNETPKSVFPSNLCYHNYKTVGMGVRMGKIESYKQTENYTKDYKYPIEAGIVNDWDSMEILLDNAFTNELKIESIGNSILLTDPPYNKSGNRSKWLELIFEKFEASQVLFANQQMLSVFGCGKLTGIGFDCGEGGAFSVPIYNGEILKQSIEYLNIGGSHLTNFLRDRLKEELKPITATTDQYLIAKDIKEKRDFYVTLDLEKEYSNIKSNPNLDYRPYELPDCNVIYVRDERFLCPEILFKPELIGSNKEGIHHVINNSINKIDSRIRNEFYDNICLSGGSTLFRGFENRLEKEINNLSKVNIKINALRQRKNLVWKGGSILASLSIMQDSFITKQDYEECGVPSLKKIRYLVVG